MKRFINKLDIDLPEPTIQVSDIVNQYIDLILKKEDEVFMESLRTMINPPIKGEITKNKLKWRGVKLIQENDYFKSVRWLEQRGKQISPKIVINCELDNKFK